MSDGPSFRVLALRGLSSRAEPYFPRLSAPSVQSVFPPPEQRIQPCAGFEQRGAAESREHGLERPRTQRELLAAMEARVEQTAREAYARGKAEGLAEGRAEGFARGRAEGEAAVRDEVAEALAAHAAVAQALVETRDHLEEAARRAAIQLAIKLAERVIAREVDDPRSLSARLDQALAAAGDSHAEPIVVKVAPALLALVHALERPLASEQVSLRFDADPSLDPGDLVVECGGRRVEAIARDQLARLEEALADG